MHLPSFLLRINPGGHGIGVGKGLLTHNPFLFLVYKIGQLSGFIPTQRPLALRVVPTGHSVFIHILLAPRVVPISHGGKTGGLATQTYFSLYSKPGKHFFTTH
jgi:hypothetical protein